MDMSPGAVRRRPPKVWWAVTAVLVVMLAGVAAKLSCLGADGLTLGETALPWCYSDVVGIHQGRGLGTNPLPYREVLTEYPPLTALQWWVAGAVTTTVTGFYLVTALIQTLAAVAMVVLLARHGVPHRRLLLIAAAPALLLVGTVNWDMVAVALLTAGLLTSGHVRRPDGAAGQADASRSDRGATAGTGQVADAGHPSALDQRSAVISGVLLGLGGLAKIFPLVAVPFLAVAAVRSGQPRWARRHVGTAAATVAVVQVPVALWAPDGWAAWVWLQRDRPVDWDTLWYGLQVAIDRPLPADVAHGLIAVASLTGVTLIMWLRRRTHAGEWWRLVLPVLTWLLLVGKVYSPQHSLWLLPLLALSRVPLPLVGAWLVADAAVVLTRFPFLAGQQGIDPSLPYWAFATPVAVRGVLMLAIVVAVLTPPGRPSAPPSGDPPAARPATTSSG